MSFGAWHFNRTNRVCPQGKYKMKPHSCNVLFFQVDIFRSPWFNCIFRNTSNRCRFLPASVGHVHMTVFSISLFCYLLSDFDSPLHGAFRVDLDSALDLPFQLHYLFEAVKSQTDMSVNWRMRKKSLMRRASVLSNAQQSLWY